MSTINQIQLPNGSTYDFEDTAAREEASSKADKTLATTSSAGLMSKEDKAKLDSLSDSGIHYVPFKLVDDYTCSTTDSFDTVMSMLQANKPVQALVNADGKVISLPVFMYDAEEIMFRNDEMYIILATTAEMIGDSILAIYGPTITDKLQDNDTTETSGQAALDAHMGKVLSDRINAVKTGAIDQIAKNTAQIETAGTATNAHSVGEYVMISNALYKVTASVAKGDTWTIGTNVTTANIGSEISSLKSDLVDTLYPVGSIYMSVIDKDPGTFIGGRWKRIKDCFLLAAGNKYPIGSAGGSASHSHTLSDNGAACIGNFSNVTAFSTGHKYFWKDYSTGTNMWVWTHNNDNQFTSSTTHYDEGSFVGLTGSTDMTNSMPPYTTVYVWLRIDYSLDY